MNSRVLACSMAVLTVILTSCGRGEVESVQELYAWMKDHGLVDSVTVGELTYVCAFSPSEVALAQGGDCDSGLFQASLIVRWTDEEKSSDMAYYDAGSVETFGLRVRDLSLTLHERVTLTVDTSSTAALGAEMDYDIGLSPRKRFLLTFPISVCDLADHDDLMIRLDDTIFGSGIVLFTFQSSSLSSLPRLKA